MFKTKGFSSNNSLKRRAVIVDAPDLPPEECEFYITSVGVADTDTVDLPESKGLDFEIETLFEEDDSHEINGDSGEKIALIQVKGIGKGTVESLNSQGIKTIWDLLAAYPEELSASISGASEKTVCEWQKNAKILLKT